MQKKKSLPSVDILAQQFDDYFSDIRFTLKLVGTPCLSTSSVNFKVKKTFQVFVLVSLTISLPKPGKCVSILTSCLKS